MNSKTPDLERMVLLSALLGVVMILLTTFAQAQIGVGLNLIPGAGANPGSDDDLFRMRLDLDAPQPSGEYWSIWLTMEEEMGPDEWNKTTRDIHAQVLFMENTTETLLLEFNHTGGLGFIQINLSYDLPEGNYTIRARVPGMDMNWKKEIRQIPLTSRPPTAVARIIIDGIPVKEGNVVLDREGRASIVLDASGSWDPDRGDTESLNYSWRMGESVIITTHSTLPWTFNRPGEYLITLRAMDPDGMFSEDSVMVHVEEIAYLPDIRVTLTPDRESIILGHSIAFTILVENVGNNDAPGFDLDLHDGGAIIKHWSMGPMQSGGERTVVFTYTPLRTGQVGIRIHADPRGEIEEFDTSNNQDRADITVEPVPVPEMVIDALTGSGPQIAGSVTNLTVVIRNNGEGEAWNVRTTLFINNEPVLEEISRSVNAGGVTTVRYAWVPKVAAIYTIHVTVEVDSSIHDRTYLYNLEIGDPTPEDIDEETGVPQELVAAAVGGMSLLAMVAAVIMVGGENIKYRLFGSVLVGPLYTRLRKEDTLRHTVRAKVYDHIITHPGDSYASILDALELKNGTLVHHLRTLERERYVKSKKDGKFRRFYPWGVKVGERDPNHLTEIQTNILDIITTDPGVSQANIAAHLRKSRQSINYQIKVMADAGLINVIRHGITTRCYLKET